MLASRFAGILPSMTEKEALESAAQQAGEAIADVAGGAADQLKSLF